MYQNCCFFFFLRGFKPFISHVPIWLSSRFPRLYQNIPTLQTIILELFWLCVAIYRVLKVWHKIKVTQRTIYLITLVYYYNINVLFINANLFKTAETYKWPAFPLNYFCDKSFCSKLFRNKRQIIVTLSKSHGVIFLDLVIATYKSHNLITFISKIWHLLAETSFVLESKRRYC